MKFAHYHGTKSNFSHIVAALPCISFMLYRYNKKMSNAMKMDQFTISLSDLTGLPNLT